MQEQKHTKVGGELVLEASGHTVVWLQLTSYTCNASFEIAWKMLNGKMDDEEATDDHVPDTDSLELLLQRDAAWPQHIGTVDHYLANVWDILTEELAHAQHAVLITVEKLLSISREALNSCDIIR